MLSRQLIGVLGATVILTLGVLSAVAQSVSMQALDSNITTAVTQPAGTATNFQIVEAEIARLATEARSRGEDAASLLSSRVRLVEGLKKSIELEGKGDTLEALRFLVRANALAAAIAGTEPVGATGTRTLDAVIDALHARIRRVASSDRNAGLTYGVKTGEQLLYRTFFVEKGRLVAFELAGDDKRRNAEWRQTVLPQTDVKLRAALQRMSAQVGRPSDDRLPPKTLPAKDIGGIAASESALVVGKMPFILVVNLASNSLSLSEETDLARGLTPLTRAGILPIVQASTLRTRPITQMPWLVAEGPVESDRKGAMLIDVATGSLIAVFPSATPSVLISTVVPKAREIANEVASDVGLTLDHPEGLIPYLVSATETRVDESTSWRAVSREQKAALVESSDFKTVEPWYALALKARYVGDWGQYAINGLTDVVWLRGDTLRTFVQYPETLTRRGFLSGNKLDQPGEMFVVRLETSLVTRPYDNAQSIERLAVATPIEVLHREKPAIAAEQTANSDLDTPPKKNSSKSAPAKSPSVLWAFVRTKNHLGWLRVAALAPRYAPDAPETSSAAETRPTDSGTRK
jgi:hypothetical protein